MMCCLLLANTLWSRCDTYTLIGLCAESVIKSIFLVHLVIVFTKSHMHVKAISQEFCAKSHLTCNLHVIITSLFGRNAQNPACQKLQKMGHFWDNSALKVI